MNIISKASIFGLAWLAANASGFTLVGPYPLSGDASINQDAGFGGYEQAFAVPPTANLPGTFNFTVTQTTGSAGNSSLFLQTWNVSVVAGPILVQAGGPVAPPQYIAPNSVSIPHLILIGGNGGVGFVNNGAPPLAGGITFGGFVGSSGIPSSNLSGGFPTSFLSSGGGGSSYGSSSYQNFGSNQSGSSSGSSNQTFVSVTYPAPNYQGANYQSYQGSTYQSSYQSSPPVQGAQDVAVPDNGAPLLMLGIVLLSLAAFRSRITR